jgi:hypothetical protein
MPKEWTVEGFPSEAAGRAIVAAFIAVACNAIDAHLG